MKARPIHVFRTCLGAIFVGSGIAALVGGPNVEWAGAGVGLAIWLGIIMVYPDQARLND